MVKMPLAFTHCSQLDRNKRTVFSGGMPLGNGDTVRGLVGQLVAVQEICILMVWDRLYLPVPT